jgi:hypothetical protein
MAQAEEEKADAPGVRLELLVRQRNEWKGERISGASYKPDGAMLVTENNVIFLGPKASLGPASADHEIKSIRKWLGRSGSSLTLVTISDDGELVLVEHVIPVGEEKTREGPNASLYDYRGKLLHELGLPSLVYTAVSKEAKTIVRFDPQWHGAWPTEPLHPPTSIHFYSLSGDQREFYRPGGGIGARSRMVGNSLAVVIAYNDRPRLALFRDQRLCWLADLGDGYEWPNAVDISPSQGRVAILTRDREWSLTLRVYDAEGRPILENVRARGDAYGRILLDSEGGKERVLMLDSRQLMCYDGTEGRLLWETSLPAPRGSCAQVLAILPAGQVVAAVSFRTRGEPPAEMSSCVFLLDANGGLLSHLELPDAGLIDWGQWGVRLSPPVASILPDGRRFWLRGARDAFLIGVVEDEPAAVGAPPDQ